MKAKTINNVIAAVIMAALVVNSLSEYADAATLAGTIFGHALLVSGLWLVINNKINERSEQ